MVKLLFLFLLFLTQNYAIAQTISLPKETARLRESKLPGYQRATQKCLICHSADLISQQPPHFSLDQWTAEVKKMQHAYGAPLDDEDIRLISLYLGEKYGSYKPSAKDSENLQAIPALTDHHDAMALLQANTCLACHSINAKVVGPSYHEVAERYRNKANALETIEQHIKAGGSGKWGPVAMPAFPQLSAEDLRVLAEFVLKQ